MKGISKFDTNNFNKIGIDPSKFDGYQILCLPENIESATTKDEIFEASHTVILSKLLKSEGVKCADSFDLGIESKVLIRQSSDYWLGLVWIMENLVLPIFVVLISDKLISWKKKNSNVHITLRLPDGTYLKYDGDPETLRQRLLELVLPKENEVP
ncbi:hypothetical protein MTYM_00656 [Methylococcales bacterium]|nr:hypothetical protein MTYM_00656 [Methylococcales bacterium]